MFGLEERHVASNPKQKDLRRVSAFFCGGKVGLIQKMGVNVKNMRNDLVGQRKCSNFVGEKSSVIFIVV